MKLWKLWAKALGEKTGNNDLEADFVAIIRTLIFITYFVTNFMICAGVLRHWNDNLNNGTRDHTQECQRQSLKQDHITPLEVSPFRP